MIRLNDNVDLTGYNVIIPCVAVGNVAELAVDLIVATLKMKRIGSGYHDACMPIMGPPAYKHDDTKTVSLEVYFDADKKIVVFQLRSPLVSFYIDSFHADLLKFIKDQKMENIYILTSSHAYEKHNVNSPIFAYIQTPEFKNVNSQQIESYGWEKYAKKNIFGGGNAIKLFEACKHLHIPTFVLFNYVSEGDNSVEASQLVREISRIVKLFDNEANIRLSIPISWEFLFGNNVPELIY